MEGERPSPVLEPQQERAQAKRQALLQSGQALFAEHGYDQVTAKEIAAHAGVAVGTFYRYFTDKKHVLMTLLSDHLEDFLPPEPRMGGSPLEVIETLIRQHHDRLRALGLGGALAAVVLRDPEVAAWADAARRRAEQKIAHRLAQLKEAGLTWPDLDPGTAAWAILTLVRSAAEAPMDGQDSDPQRRRLAALIAHLIHPPSID